MRTCGRAYDFNYFIFQLLCFWIFPFIRRFLLYSHNLFFVCKKACAQTQQNAYERFGSDAFDHTFEAGAQRCVRMLFFYYSADFPSRKTCSYTRERPRPALVIILWVAHFFFQRAAEEQNMKSQFKKKKKLIQSLNNNKKKTSMA